MVILCWAAKGGSGTTVVASALALSSPRPALLVDLDGELPAVLGLPAPDRPGVAEWLLSATSTDHLAELLIDVGLRTQLLPWCSAANERAHADRDRYEPERWAILGDWLRDQSGRWGRDVVVDAGTREPPAALAERSDRSLLVTRPCYLSLRRAGRLAVRPTGVVLVDEPGHALGHRDVEHALGVPVEAVLDYDPAVSRAVDAGLLAARLPRVMSRAFRRVAA